MKYRNTTAYYAQKYDVTERTISRWKSHNYPLDDPSAMSARVSRQKNVPDSFQDGKSPGTRGLSPRVYTALVMGRWMQVRANRWGRRLVAAMAKSEPADVDRTTVADFAYAMIRREIRCGIDDMLKACSGASLTAVRAQRRAEDADFYSPDDDEEEEN